MSTIKTNELIEPALDWVVAKCRGLKPFYRKENGNRIFLEDKHGNLSYDNFNPSIRWDQGGPIIERERIGVSCHFADWSQSWHWCGKIGGLFHHGETPLIAAMRCYVASKLGDTVDVPEELK